MVIEICPTCGSTLPSEAEKLFPHSRIKQKIYEALKKYPDITTDQLMLYVYKDDPDGGPMCNVISVNISAMRPILHEHGMGVRATRGQGSTYHLYKLKPKPAATTQEVSPNGTP